MISRDTLISFFADTRRLRENGQAQFDIDDTCRWSFFFVDPLRSKLEPLASHLAGVGYEVKDLLDPDSESERPVYFLRADRIERHTVDTLAARNDQLYELAARFGVEDYDGMDVGEVDGL